MKSLRIYAACFSLAAIALAGASAALAAENPQTMVKFWPVIDKVVGGVYTETIQIFSTAGYTLDSGILQVELDASQQFVSSSPAGSASGNVVTIAVPAISAGSSFTAQITTQAVSTDNFAVAAASYFVNGDRVGFMGAPAVVDTSGSAAGIAEGDGAGGPTDEEAALADTLPRTGTDPVASAYFTLGLLLLSWGVLRSKPVL